MIDGQLPGEDALTLSRALTRVPLEAFKRVDSGLRWPIHLDWFFVQVLLFRSYERRNKAGPSGLIVEAARVMLVDMIPDLKRLYRQREIYVSVSEAEMDRLADELADEMMKRPKLRADTIEMLNLMREIIVTDQRKVVFDEYLSEYGALESAKATFARWLDYTQTQIDHGFVRRYFGVHRLLICCLRVYDAVFGTDNLHVRRS
jgi:hypothetical protein